MIKCKRRQATDPQKLNKIVNGRFPVFLWVEAEAVDEIAASTSLLQSYWALLPQVVQPRTCR